MSPKKFTRNFRRYNCSFKYTKFLIILSWALTILLPTWTDNPIISQTDIAQAALLPDTPRATLSTMPQSVATAVQPPMQFEPNLGQTDPQVHFMARGMGYTVFLTPTEAVLVLSAGQSQPAGKANAADTLARDRQILHLQVLEANPTPVIRGVHKSPTTIHRLIGPDPAHWQTQVPTYAQVRYDAIYPGIDLLYYGNHDQLEYDFIVHPGADPSAITLGIQGAHSATLEEDGHLLLSVPGGTLRLQKPVLSQIVEGQHTDVAGHFFLREAVPSDADAPIQVAFAVGDYDPTLPLIIDPLVNYASAFGGEGQDIGEAITVDTDGHSYVVGTTESFTFPVTATAFQDSAASPNQNVFVTKFDTETSEILFSTYIGGEGNDRATGVAVDTQGIPYVTGETTSLTFPTQIPLQATRQGPSDAFALKLAADGSSLLYSTYLGGSGPDHANGIVVDAQGQAVLTGTTSSPDFPMMNAPDPSLGHGEAVPQSDVFVSKLDAQGAALQFSTYLGGAGSDVGHSLTLDAQGAIYLTGATSSGTGFPVTPGAFQSTYGGGTADAFIAKINPFLAGTTTVQYASYLGGSGEEVGLDLLVDAQQHTFITGWTTGRGQAPIIATPSPAPAANAPVTTWGRHSRAPVAGNLVRGFGGGMRSFSQQQSAPPAPAPVLQRTPPTPLPAFPVTPNAYDATFNGKKDAFLAQVNMAGSGTTDLVYATYVGGSQADTGTAIGVDSLDRVCIAGTTASTDYPVKNALADQGTLQGGTDGFVTKFQTDLTTLLFSSFLGGSGTETISDMRLDKDNNAYLTGQTRSTDFPLLTALDDTSLTGEPQAFVVKVKDPVTLRLNYAGPLSPAPRVGEISTFELQWSNLGPDEATGVQLELDFTGNSPDIIRYDSIVNTGGSSNISNCSGSALSGPGGTLTCDVGNIPPTNPPVFSTANVMVEALRAGSFDSNYDAEITAIELDAATGGPSVATADFFGDIDISPALVNLTVDFQGSGTGRVVASPGIGTDATSTIQTDATLPYNSGTNVSLTATPTGQGSDASDFIEWTGSGCTSSNSTITVNMTQSRTCNVIFNLSTVTVPNVVGQSQAAATTAINGVTGLSVGAVTQAASASVPSGSVISQNPGPGSAPNGSTVALVISTGPAPVTVPNVVGQSQTAATTAINGVTGLSVGAVTQAASASVPSGSVISQNPGPGSAPNGSTVALVISTGPAPVTVPNVVGQSQAAATTAINGVTGLSVGAVTQAASASVPSGSVISQNPGPGSAPNGSTVALVISTGPAPVTVPNVVGQSQTAATTAINGVTGLSVGAVTQAASASVPSGSVISQNPGPGSAPNGSTVALVISTGPAPVTVPNVVGQSQAAATTAINGVTGLSVGAVTQAASASVPSGSVISQNPGPGSAPNGSSVALVISTGPAPVTVPNVVGQSQAAATTAINGVTGLSVGAVTQANDASVPSGSVISQNPGPGSAPNGSSVALVISTGPAPVTVPNVLGQTQAAATAAINAVNGLSVGAVTQANDASVPSGSVISQNPGPGSAPNGSSVALVISTGPAPAPVPNVLGQTQAAATAAINAVNGLSVGAVTQDNDASVPSGSVISQNPGPGSAPNGSSVALVISTGPAPVTVPNVLGQTQAAATAAINAVNGLSVGAVTQDNDASVPSGSVISQNPRPGSAPFGTTISLVVSLGPVQRTLTVTPNPNGTITGTGITCGSDCTETVNNGTQLTLTAAPNPSFFFTGWTVSGNPAATCPGTGTCTITLNTNRRVTATFATNQGPVVEAGPNQVINLPAGASLPINITLAGTVTDDGLPSPDNLTFQWSLVSGPATIPGIPPGFEKEAMPTVSFPAIGSYILELSARDGALSAQPDTVTVTINDPSAPQVLVPSVIGQSEAAATPALTTVDLTLGTITQELNANVPAGSVIRQSPIGGAFADQGTPVNLVISSSTELLITTPVDGPDAVPGDGVCETDSGNGSCSLRAAIQEANAFPGQQTITLASETYQLTLAGGNEDAAATGDLDIRDDLIIESVTGNASDVIITANSLDRVFDIPPGSSPNVTLRGLTIQDGLIANSTGGGIRNAQGTLTVEDSVVTTNQSNGSGGGLSHLSGIFTLRNTEVTNNTSEGLGGGLQTQEGTVTIDGNTRFTGNTANFGGGLSTGGANVSLTNVLVENNTAEGDGGGIYKFLSPGDLLGSIQAPRVALSNTTVRNNTLVSGDADDCAGYLDNVGGNTFGSTDGCTLLAP